MKKRLLAVLLSLALSTTCIPCYAADAVPAPAEAQATETLQTDQLESPATEQADAPADASVESPADGPIEGPEEAAPEATPEKQESTAEVLKPAETQAKPATPAKPAAPATTKDAEDQTKPETEKSDTDNLEDETPAALTESRTGNFSTNYTLGGDPAQNIIAVARAQLGKTKAQLGYTEPWCADFVCDCAKLAGIPDNVIAHNYSGRGSVGLLYNFMINNGMATAVSTRQAGDLVCYYCTSHGTYEHIGIVVDGTHSYEGNMGGAVKDVSYSISVGCGHGTSDGTVVKRYLRPKYVVNTNVAFDVNVTVNGQTYNGGVDFCTFDVTIGGSLKGNDVKDYYSDTVPKGTTYLVNDIKVSGCYKNNGPASYSGTANGTVTVTIPLVTQHKSYTSAVTKAATCTEKGVKTYTCSGCGHQYTEEIAATGHDYKMTVTPPTCTTAGKISYKCSRCNHSYEETGEWTGWTDQKPASDIPGKIYESATFYRYRDTVDTWEQTGSGSIEYASLNENGSLSWPAGFNTGSGIYSTYNRNPVQASETSTAKTTVSNTRIGWIYWHWCYNSYAYGPINRTIESQYSSTHPGFHAFFSTEDVPVTTSANARRRDNADVCKDTYWWLVDRVPIYRCSYTNYTKKSSAGVWSDWSRTQPTASSTRTVESKTMYRYNNSVESMAATGHKYDNGAIIVQPTTTASGLKVYTCTVCGATRTETLPMIIPEKVTITGNPKSQTVTEGFAVSFSVNAAGSGLTYQWQYSTNGGYSWVNSGADSAKTSKLSMIAAANMDGRLFRCVVTDSSGNKATSDIAMLTISYPFKITTQPENVTAGLNSTVSFHVAAEGKDVTYRWQYSKDGGMKWVNSNGTGATTDTLSFKVATSNAANLFRCQVTSGKNVLYTSSVHVDLIPGVVINLNPQSQAAAIGEYATFTIDAENAASYQWQYSKDGAHWYNSGAEGNKTDTLKVKGAQNSQGNRYRCVVTGIDGNKKKSLACAMIVLKEVPRYSLSAVGSTAIFSLKAEGIASYQWQYSKDGGKTWYKSGATGAETDTLTFKVTTSSRACFYRCKLTTEEGAYAFTSPVGFLNV